jgi:hypothetical protein
MENCPVEPSRSLNLLKFDRFPSDAIGPLRRPDLFSALEAVVVIGTVRVFVMRSRRQARTTLYALATAEEQMADLLTLMRPAGRIKRILSP